MVNATCRCAFVSSCSRFWGWEDEDEEDVVDEGGEECGESSPLELKWEFWKVVKRVFHRNSTDQKRFSSSHWRPRQRRLHLEAAHRLELVLRHDRRRRGGLPAFPQVVVVFAAVCSEWTRVHDGLAAVGGGHANEGVPLFDLWM